MVEENGNVINDRNFQVMGLMLGEFVDEYTVNVIDVFAMPQSGTVTYFKLPGFVYCFCNNESSSIQ